VRNVSNISSEEELLELRNDGKITEDEYNDLLNAVKTCPADNGVYTNVTGKSESKSKTGKIAFLLMLVGIILPFSCFFIIETLTPPDVGSAIWPWFFLGLALEITALALGVISWTDSYGKATVITISAVAVLILLNWLRSNKNRVTYKKEHLLRTAKMEPVQIARQRDVQERTLKQGSAVTELEAFALDDLQGLITQSGVSIDKAISSDGNGSLRIDVTEPTTIHLFETGDIDIENARLIYQAKVRTKNVQGQVYLEMWCHFPAKGEFFSKGLLNPLTGTTDWTTVETFFFFNKAENPDNVKLNLVVDGNGTVWIDDIRLLKGALE